MRRRLVPALLIVLLAACDDSRDVHVVSRTIRELHTNQGRYDFATFSDIDDFSGSTTSAFILGENGFDTYPGFGFLGAIVVPNVPKAEYYLAVADTAHFVLAIVSNANDLDISEIALGRPVLQIPTATTTSVRLDLTNLAPWQSGDEIEAFSLDTGIVLRSLEDFAGPTAPQVGAAQLEGFDIDFDRYGIPLIIGDPFGDFLTILQLSARESDTGIPYLAASRIFDAPTFTMEDGKTSTLTGAFTDIPLTKSLAVSWKASAFEQRRTEVSPHAVLAGAALEIRVLPNATELGAYESRSPILVSQELASPVADAGEMISYGDPFPDVLDEIATYLYQIDVDVLADGATVPLAMRVGFMGEELVEALGGSLSIEPKLTSVTAPLINGADAFMPQSGVGLEPELSWSAPAVGTPNGYEVSVLRVSAAGGTTRADPVAHIITENTEVRIPPTTFLPGEAYVARIDAFSTVSRDVQRAPFRVALPSHRASVLTAIFRP